MPKFIVIDSAVQSFDTQADAMEALRASGRLFSPHFVIKAEIVNVVSPSVEYADGGDSKWRDLMAEKRANMNAKQLKSGAIGSFGDAETDSSEPKLSARALRF